MFVKSFRLTGRRVIGVGLMCAAVVLLAAHGVHARANRDAEPSEAEVTVKVSRSVEKGVVKTGEDRVAFLAQFGWETEAEPAEIVEIVIPEEFDEVYEKYNQLQKEQGYDLMKYRGKRCKRYTYLITNYPDQPENVRANLLVLDGRVIGGDVCSTDLDGFMHGFAADSATLAPLELEIPLEEHGPEPEEES